MDTLTNVVGILIIILILVQLNVSQAMKKIMSELPQASIEEVTKLREQSAQQAASLTASKDNVEQLEREADAVRAELAKLTPELDVLERTAAQTKVPLLDLDTLRKQLEEKQKEVEKDKAVMAALLAEQDRLKAALADTPLVAPPAPKIVRLPNSRPIPEKAKIERYLISGGQLYHLDVEAAVQLA
ncbi:MAG: hypothetical protein M3463_15405, partial [Verrucomicrobiota bacterium]|nr:hypothetical protein [Verrucomicrobiota bacterium]